MSTLPKQLSVKPGTDLITKISKSNW